MEEGNKGPKWIDPKVVTTLLIPVLRKESENRQKEVSYYEDIVFDGPFIQNITLLNRLPKP